MNLDDMSVFRALDSRGFLTQINSLPEQLEQAYDLGMSLPLPDCATVDRVLIAGMGASVAGPDLFAGWALDRLDIPFFFQRDYSLPAWVGGTRSLVIAVCHCGETEETISMLEQAAEAGCSSLVLTTGGHIAEMAARRAIPAWIYPHRHESRTAIGWTFGLLHTLAYRLNWLPDPSEELRDGLHAMRNAQMNLLAEVPAVRNPAKRMAGQMVGRWVAIFSAGYLAPITRRWKTQLNEVAKTWAQAELIPDADHNLLEGLANPDRPLQSVMALFLRAPDLDPRNLRRLDLTREFAMQQGLNTDFLDARGHSRFARLWTSLLFADYTAYYLAMAYGVDPNMNPAVETFHSLL